MCAAGCLQRTLFSHRHNPFFVEDMLSISAPEDDTVLNIPAVRYSCMICVTHVGVTCPAALHKEVTKSTCVLIV